jgi:CBS domain-containing protein
VVHAVGDARVSQLMTTQMVAVPRGTTIGTLVRDFLLPRNLRAIPVMDGGRLAGLVTIGDLRKIDQSRWPTTPVDEVMTPASDVPTVAPNDDLALALERFGEDLPLLPVIDAGALVGLLYRESVHGYVRMKEMLGVDSRR